LRQRKKIIDTLQIFGNYFFRASKKFEAEPPCGVIEEVSKMALGGEK
jgi:hypothetical protein